LLHNLTGDTEEDARYKVHDFHTEVPYIKPDDATISAVKHLARNYSLVVVSLRGADYAQKTRQWLERHFPGAFSDIIIFGSDKAHAGLASKLELLKRLKASVLIDDSLRQVKEAQQVGVKSIWFGDLPWQTEPTPPGIHRAKTWAEVERMLRPPH
jgi:FMN phosphatase YigB (HAD superfamily)